MIKGIKIVNLKVIKNTSGNIIKYLSKSNSYFKKFGEVYLNEIKKNRQKGWNLHKKNSCIITVATGKVLFTISDKDFKKKSKIILDKQKPRILIIKPNLWFKFKSLDKDSIIINLIENLHDPNEIKKKPIQNIK